MYTSAHQKRSKLPVGMGGAASPASRMQGGVPNSLALRTVQQREQAQIPNAENEADRLSASVKSGTPDTVKALMGQRMGADFSGVRFHTGAAAAAKADAVGARAYTSGADVYFGEGGFDASVAAHELVHTVQQGMVDSSVSTMSTPVGGVQRLGNPFKWGWNKTGGRMIRKNHDAMMDLKKAKDEGDWEKMSKLDKTNWIVHNPVAYMKMLTKGNQTKTAERIEKRKKEMERASEFLAKDENKLKNSSMLATDENGELAVTDTRKADEVHFAQRNHSARKILKKAIGKTGSAISDTSSATDNFVSPTVGITGDSLKLGGLTNASNVLGAVGGGLGVGTGVVDSIQDGKDVVENLMDRQYLQAASSGSGFLGDLTSIGSNISGIHNAITDADGSMISGGVLDIATGLFEMGKGGIDMGQSLYHRKKLNKLDAKYKGKTRDELGKNKSDLLAHDILAQGKMENTRKAINGFGDVLTGGIDMAGGIAALSGAGPAGSIAAKGASSLVKVGFTALDKLQKHRMEKKVIGQTVQITDDMVKKFQEESGITNFSRAKQALYKSMGYSTGQRAEAYADQTEKRGRYLASKANKDKNSEERKIIKALGVKSINGTYDEEKVANAMGLHKSRAAVAKKQSRMNYLIKSRPSKPSNVQVQTPQTPQTPQSQVQGTPPPVPAKPAAMLGTGTTPQVQQSQVQGTPPPVPAKPAAMLGTGTTPQVQQSQVQGTPPPIPAKPAAMKGSGAPSLKRRTLSQTP